MQYNRFVYLLVLFLLFLAFFSFPCTLRAADGDEEVIPPVKGIDIRGLKRIDEEAVRSRMTQRVGDLLDAEKVSSDIKSIFEMGYFEDVRVEIEPFEGGIDLIYIITEKPAVRDVEFFGNQEIEDSDLDEGITISPGSIADTVLIQDNANKLKKMYEEEGYPLVNVVPVVRRFRGSVLLTYLIYEGPRVKIEEIIFEGNENMKSRKIEKAMETSEWWLLSYFTSSGRYEKEEIRRDVVRIRDLYYDNGFLEVVVSEPVLGLSEDKEWMNIKFNISEGSQYNLSSIAFSGNTVFSDEELIENMELSAGEVFSKKLMASDVSKITDMYGEKGYAVANVFPDIRTEEEKKEAGLLFRIHEGDKYKIGRIDITGNVDTRDKVIRREVRLSEGEDYNSKLLKRSYQRILNLKYFDQVRLKPVPRVKQKKMDIGIDVEERATGSVVVGVGYSSVDKFIAMAQFTQGNLGGRGQTLKFETEFGSTSTTFELSFTEPWLFDRDLSLTTAAYRTKDEFTSYDKKATGISIGLSKSFREYWRWGTTYSLEDAEVFDLDDDASSIIREQEGTSLTSAITPGISRDTRDNVLDPHTGSRNKLTFTFAGLGGDNKFYKYGIDSAWFFPVTKSTTLSLRGRYSQADGLFGETLPLYERYHVGGITTLRGQRTVGPEDEEGVYIGGERRLLFNVDYVFPVFPEMRLNGVLFFDSGSAFDKFEDMTMRNSTGVGVRWSSPVGPIRLEWAYNINPDPDDASSRFEFSMGTFF
jgi:outer membrane protein insertion porin family